jgi:O-antigen ligase
VLDKTNPWRVWIFSLLIAIMPLSFALPIKAKALPALILFLTGLWMLATSADVRRAYRRAAPVLAPAAIAFAFWAVNVGAHGVNWREFDVTSHILAFLVIAATFALPFRTAVLRIGFSGSAGVLGLVCVEQHYVEHIDRVYGINNGEWGAIEFGMFMLVLSLIAIVQALRGELRPRERAMHAVFAAIGFYGALLTQSRGPLLAFVPVFAALMLIQGRRTGRWRQSVLALVIGVAAAGLAATTLHGEMVERLAAVKDEVATYSEQDATGAVRERLEMWRTARMAVIAHPVTGVGMNQFGPFARARIADGEVNPSVVRYDHPHSEYLEWAATGGIPGLLVLMLLFGGSLVYFGRHALNPDNAIAMPACAGFSTTAMYALCAFTDNVFYRAMPHSLYFFITLGLAVYVGRVLDRRRVGAGAS